MLHQFTVTMRLRFFCGHPPVTLWESVLDRDDVSSLSRAEAAVDSAAGPDGGFAAVCPLCGQWAAAVDTLVNGELAESASVAEFVGTYDPIGREKRLGSG